MVPHGFSMLKVNILFSILRLTAAQAPPGENNERNCTLDELPSRRAPVSFDHFNATGKLNLPEIKLGDGVGPSQKNWTWSIGVQHLAGGSGMSPYIFDAPVWLDTHGTDLASEDVDFQMCFRAMPGLPLSVQRKGQGDTGDCKKVLSEKCVADWLEVVSSRARNFVASNSTTSTRRHPCQNLSQYIPDSCGDFKTSVTYSGSLPPINRTCAFGLGDPDYDTFLRAGRDDDAGITGNKTVNLAIYDELVTGYLPLLVVGYAKSTSNGTAGRSGVDARMMCLKTTEFAAGSRKPTGVPALSSNVRVGSLLAITGVATLMLLF